MRRVVITGIGAVTPVGNSAGAMWEAMKAGKNGIDAISLVDVSDMAVNVAGEVKNFDATEYMDKKLARRMDRFCQFGCAAGIMAMKDAGFTEKTMPDKKRFGTLVGSGIGGLATVEKEVGILREKGPKRVSPLFVPVMISNMISGNLAIMFDLRGHSTCVVTACATGTNAIGDAFRLIKHGYQDAMLTGGAEATITRLAFSGFLGLSALSTAEDKDRASIPFDKERTGFVMGEGSGVLVLEEYEHAKKRGAKIYAEVLGYGATSDAYHMTAPRPDAEGAADAMRLAMEEGGISPEMIGYINAHGTSTEYNDKFETKAIKDVFGENAPAVSSTKSMTGHMLGAAGAVEAIAAALAIDDSVAPPTINYRVPDEACDLDIVPNEARSMDIDYALSNSFGFGGHNGCLLLGKVK